MRDDSKDYKRKPKQNYKPETFAFSVRLPVEILSHWDRKRLAELIQIAVAKKLKKDAT